MKTPSKKKSKVLLIENDLLNSQWIAQYLIELTHPDYADIHVIRILPVREHPIVTTLYMGGAREIHPPALTEKEMGKSIADEEKKGRAALQETCHLLLKSGLNAIPVLRRGATLQEIIKYTQEEAIDLIVAGTNKPRSFQTWQAYNIIRKLIKCSKCPVLLINKPRHLENWRSVALGLSK